MHCSVGADRGAGDVGGVGGDYLSQTKETEHRKRKDADSTTEMMGYCHSIHLLILPVPPHVMHVYDMLEPSIPLNPSRGPRPPLFGHVTTVTLTSSLSSADEDRRAPNWAERLDYYIYFASSYQQMLSISCGKAVKAILKIPYELDKLIPTGSIRVTVQLT